MEGRCGQPTGSGAPCRIKVLGGGPCHLHKTDNQCSVCLLNMTDNNTRRLECGHTFHRRCVDRWKMTCTGSPTCPMCRMPFDVPQYRCILTIQRVSDGASTQQDVPMVDMERVVRDLGLQLRELTDESVRMDVAFNIEQNEDIRFVLQELGILHFTLPAFSPPEPDGGAPDASSQTGP
jgi:hypothetical protein